ncbi:MAG: alpha-2-macroglobulin, partial [Chloroflexi bacterium]
PPPTPLPPTNPIVVEYTPDRGEENRLDGPITLYFDQPMDRVSVEKAIRIQPAVEGKLVWLDDRTVQFRPTSRLKRAQRYRVSVGQEARSKAGLPLARPVQFTFQTVGYLEVSQVIPAPGTQDVATDSVITVFFNRPVVPLVGVEEQANLPQPLEIDPPVSGHGEWINTSIYTFYPDRLAPGQTYQVRVPAGLEDTTGGELADDYTWTFTTEQPRVLDIYPADGAFNVALTTVISVTFNQPMDRASTEAAFLLNTTGGDHIPGRFRWNEDGTEMGFVPASLLPLESTLNVFVGPAATAAEGTAHLDRLYRSTFSTVPYPHILGTDPGDGDQNVQPGQGFTIYFDAPIRPETVMEHVTILPAPTEVYTYWNRYDTSFYIGFDALPSTDYEVRITPGITDPYGNPTEQDLIVRYRTRALSPQAYLRVPGQVGVYSAYAESTDLFAVYRNVSRLDFSLYRLTLAQFQQLTGPRSWDAWEKFRPEESAELMRQWSVQPEAALNETALHRARLAGPEGGPLPPGFYFLELNTPETRRSRSYYGQRRHLLVVADAQLTLKMGQREVLVWATDLQTGQPVAGLPITLYDAGMKSLAQGQTDAEGVFQAHFDAPLDLWGAYYAVAKEEGHLAVAFNQWSDGIAPWDFNLNSNFDPSPFSLYLYTDRPIYRPGQTVYFKGIVRQDDDARYSLPPLRELPVTIRDDEGKVVYSDTLSLSAMGTFHGEFVLDEEATLGYYYLYARVPKGVAGLKRPLERGVGFRVAEYRRPEFQVSVTPDKDAYLHGETIRVVVQARYFFGGPVTNAPVQWTLTSDDYFFHWGGPGRYDWTDSDNYRPWWWGGFESFGEVIASGEGVTDEEGRFIFEVPADIADRSTSQRFTLEATVTDVNDRTVSDQATVIVHKGRFYIGLRPERYVGKVNEPQTVDVRTVDWEGEPYPGADLTVTFYHREWFSVQEEDPHGRLYWTWTFSDTAVATATLTTDQEGQGTASFVPPAGGSYIVRAVGQDDAGNTVRSSTFLWVSSSTYVAWRQENNDRIELVTDKASYRPGETAEILIPSPYQGAVWALFTVERGHILEHQVLTLESNSQVLRLPIRPEYAPNVYVSVVLVKGVDETNPVPSFKVGYATFTVSPEQQELTITLTPDKEVYGPRERATFTIQATDYRGQAVTAEISLALVDLSVLTLADPNAPPITDHFYGERGLGVRTATGLTLSGDRVTEQVITEAKGGGGGGQAGAGFIRRRFPDTAYWAPAVLTDEGGRAQVQVDLPDNLTTWRLLAKGVTAETLVGEAQVEIVTTKELLVRPITPRFFVVGDRAQVGAVVHNNTDRDLTVDVALTATGVDLEGPATQMVEVPAHGKVRVDWTVTVPNRPGEEQFADLTFSARGGGLSDASKPTLGIPPDQRLPIYKYTAPETVGTAGTIEEAEARLELIALPRRIEVTQGELTLRLDPSLAAGMTEGLRYLEHYPYECTEQTVSRFLPNVLTYRA